MLLKRLINLSFHLIFWGVFFGLFFLQNSDPSWNDLLIWLFILAVSAITIYTNLYVLIPRFLNKQSNILYGIGLIVTVSASAAVLYLLIPREHPSYGTPYFQHLVNLLFFVFISSSIFLLRRRYKKQKRLENLEKEQLSSELKLLKAQVNPHFLLNTLNNLYGLILEKKNDNAAEVVLKLSSLMRYLLESNKREKVRLAEEINFIEDYLVLEKIRSSNPLSIKFEKNLDEEDIDIIPMILIPLVENIFKHAELDQGSGGYALINLTLNENTLSFSTENTVGSKKIVESTRIGLENLKQRLSLAYPNRHSFVSKQENSTFYAFLTITL